MSGMTVKGVRLWRHGSISSFWFSPFGQEIKVDMQPLVSTQWDFQFSYFIWGNQSLSYKLGDSKKLFYLAIRWQCTREHTGEGNLLNPTKMSSLKTDGGWCMETYFKDIWQRDRVCMETYFKDIWQRDRVYKLPQL